MDKSIENDLDQLRDRLLRMASLAERAVRQSIQALHDGDEALARQVVAEEESINAMHVGIDEEVVQILTLHQTVEADLRFVIAASRINSNLERIGDQAVNIAEAVLRIVNYPRVQPNVDLPRMGNLAGEMVRDSLNALVNRDEELARAVLTRDDTVDDLRDQIFRELLTYMMGNASMVFPVFELILVAKDLERIGDHATNIAEAAIYVSAGLDVRHHGIDLR